MGTTEHTTEVPVPASVLIYPSPIIYGQLDGWKLEESSPFQAGIPIQHEPDW